MTPPSAAPPRCVRFEVSWRRCELAVAEALRRGLPQKEALREASQVTRQAQTALREVYRRMVVLGHVRRGGLTEVGETRRRELIAWLAQKLPCGCPACTAEGTP